MPSGLMLLAAVLLGLGLALCSQLAGLVQVGCPVPHGADLQAAQAQEAGGPVHATQLWWRQLRGLF